LGQGDTHARPASLAKKDAFGSVETSDLTATETLHCGDLNRYKRYLGEHPTCDCRCMPARFISQRRFDGFMTEESRVDPPPGLHGGAVGKYELGWRPWMEEKDGNDRGGLFEASTSVYSSD